MAYIESKCTRFPSTNEFFSRLDVLDVLAALEAICRIIPYATANFMVQLVGWIESNQIKSIELNWIEMKKSCNQSHKYIRKLLLSYENNKLYQKGTIWCFFF